MSSVVNTSESHSKASKHDGRTKTNKINRKEAHRRDGGDSYTSEDLEHLSDLEHVRERPGMYIGDTTARGLHHLVYEVVDNSIDEAMAGHATTVSVTINVDGSVTVEDDGRGIPVERHAQLSEEVGRDVSTLEGVMTVLKFGGKFEKGAYQTSGGLHGVGVTVVNFLSEWCEVEVCRDGYVYHQEYERGVPKTDVRRVGHTTKRGTKTTFKPDPQIFPNTKFVYATLHKRMQELAFLNQGVRITIADDRTGESESFQYERRPRRIHRAPQPRQRAGPRRHPLRQRRAAKASRSKSPCSTRPSTPKTSTPTSTTSTRPKAARTSPASAPRSPARSTTTARKRACSKTSSPRGEDFREGLTAVISCRVPHPQFEGQTKTKLGNGEVEGIVNSLFGEYLTKFLEENPKAAKAIVQQGPARRRSPRRRPQGRRS